MNKFLPLLSALLLLFAFSSCRDNNASPVRNVRFDPDLLNKMQVANHACTSYGYFDNGQSVSLGPVYTRQVLVSFEDNLPLPAQQRALEKYGFVKGMGPQVYAASTVLQPLTLEDGLSCKQVEQALLTLAADTQVTYAAPYFLSGKQLLGVSDVALVTIREGSLNDLEALVQDYKAEMLPPLTGNVYRVQVNKLSKGNALELANFLQGQPGIVQAVPDFIVAAK